MSITTILVSIEQVNTPKISSIFITQFAGRPNDNHVSHICHDHFAHCNSKASPRIRRSIWMSVILGSEFGIPMGNGHFRHWHGNLSSHLFPLSLQERVEHQENCQVHSPGRISILGCHDILGYFDVLILWMGKGIFLPILHESGNPWDQCHSQVRTSKWPAWPISPQGAEICLALHWTSSVHCWVGHLCLDLVQLMETWREESLRRYHHRTHEKGTKSEERSHTLRPGIVILGWDNLQHLFFCFHF